MLAGGGLDEVSDRCSARRQRGLGFRSGWFLGCSTYGCSRCSSCPPRTGAAYRRIVSADSWSDQDEVRGAELIAALCLATDLGTEVPLEHGLHSTLVAMRLAERLGVDSQTAAQTYYGCLLFHAGCTADAEIS